MRRSAGVLAAVGIVGILLAGSVPCRANHADARRRANQVVREEPTAEDVAAEIRFGRELAARVLARLPLDPDEELNRYVNLVGTAVAQSCGRPELTFHFAVLDVDTVNAWAAPGGYVFVTRGTLARLHDEAELAGVLAHEIAHVSRRHIVRELGIEAPETDLTAAVARFLGGGGEPAAAALRQSVDAALHILFERGYRVDDEFEADRVAASLLAQTGYPDGALARFLDRARSLTDADESWKRSHPATADRVARLRARRGPAATSARPDPSPMKERFLAHVHLP